MPRPSPCVDSLSTAHPAEGSRVGRFGALSGWPRLRCAAGDVCLHRWRLGFKQSGLHRSARVLRVPAVHTFRPLSLPHHALVPFGFRRKVGWATQKPTSSKLLPAARGIDDWVKRRTWSRRPARYQPWPVDPSPSAPPRTVRAAFTAHGSPVGGQSRRSALGITPTSLPFCRPPGALRPVAGFPDRPGGSSRPRLLRPLRDPGARAR